MAVEFAIRFSKRTDRLVLAARAWMMLSSTHGLEQYIISALYPTRENVLNAFCGYGLRSSSRYRRHGKGLYESNEAPKCQVYLCVNTVPNTKVANFAR
jgi:hypothetical protein